MIVVSSLRIYSPTRSGRVGFAHQPPPHTPEDHRRKTFILYARPPVGPPRTPVGPPRVPPITRHTSFWYARLRVFFMRTRMFCSSFPTSRFIILYVLFVWIHRSGIRTKKYKRVYTTYIYTRIVRLKRPSTRLDKGLGERRRVAERNYKLLFLFETFYYVHYADGVVFKFVFFFFFTGA